jgi:PHD/YefM family antitoxin component YafN of YafNO toxin-antitoxin module
MTNIPISTFRNNAFEYFNQAIEFNDVINVTTKRGNAVVISEQDYNGLMETLYLNQFPGTIRDIEEASEAPWEEFVTEEEFWEDV